MACTNTEAEQNKVEATLFLLFPCQTSQAIFRISFKMGVPFLLPIEFPLSRCPLYKKKRKKAW